MITTDLQARKRLAFEEELTVPLKYFSLFTTPLLWK